MAEKRGIALLITLLFVIAITASIGIGLKQVNLASKEVEKEKFMLQTRIAIADIIKILQNSNELDYIVKNKSPEALFTFLSQTAFIPFESSGVRMLLEIKSARSRFNPNSIIQNDTTNNIKADSLKEYLSKYNIDSVFVDIMLDNMGGIKEDLVYNSDIFYEKPELYRDRIASEQHFNEIKDFYSLTYHDNSLKNINFKNLFFYPKDKNVKIDLNYASVEVWEMILGSDRVRAEELYLARGTYTSIADLDLQDDETSNLKKYNRSYFEPFLDVSIEIIQDNYNAKVNFEYDIAAKKGKNFSYDI